MWLFASKAFTANQIMQKWLGFEFSRLWFALTVFIVNLIVMTFVFYIAGIIVVGRKRALFSDAFVISLLGSIIGALCTLFFPVIGILLALLVWLVLIRHYYETGWLGAIAVGILAIIIYVVVLIILAILMGLGLLFLWSLLA